MNRTIIYSSPFVPPEWIAAHGLRPFRLIPDRPSSPAPQGACPFAAAFTSAAMASDSANAIILTTTCDQMRRFAERLTRTPLPRERARAMASSSQSSVLSPKSSPPTFTMNIPATWQTLSAQRLYLDELYRLSRFLVSLGGTPPTPAHLTHQILLYDTARTTLLEQQPTLSARAFAEAIETLNQSPRRVLSNAKTRVSSPNNIPLALLGGPLRLSDRILYDLIEPAGGRVALDATETGQRTLPPPVNPRTLAEDPLLELADIYFRIPDVFRRPNTLLYQYLRQQLAHRAIRGILLVRHVWCDLWHAELSRLKEWTKIPVVEIDLGGDEGDQHRTRTRIESLLESLR